MNLEDSRRAQDWLAQFHGADKEVARQLLRKLTLVSQAQFEIHLQQAVESVLLRVKGENVALFSIKEPPSPFNIDGTRRTSGSSADRVKHLLENIVRVHGDRVRANPTVNSMRSDRIRNIVLVEDFIGSGDRISGYWHAEVSKSVKSWISYKWIKPWVISYAALDMGVLKLQKTIPSLTKDRIVTVLPTQDQRLGVTSPILKIAEKYGKKLRGDMWAGYAGGSGTVIFQHGCPNNVLAILWAGNGRFKPLFPNRGIPTELQRFFGTRNVISTADDLWNYRQYNLALALLEHFSQNKPSFKEWAVIVALGFASRLGVWDDARLQQCLRVPLSEVAELRRKAYTLNLIDKQTHIVLPFGKELLDRLRKPKQAKANPIMRLSKLTDLYYPDSCEGVSKH